MYYVYSLVLYNKKMTSIMVSLMKNFHPLATSLVTALIIDHHQYEKTSILDGMAGYKSSLNLILTWQRR